MMGRSGRWLVVCTSLLLLLGGGAVVASQAASASGPWGHFSDVPLEYWCYQETEACVGAGIVEGYGDGTYRPSVPVTRDQMAAYISRALAGGDENVPAGPAEPTFADVSTDYWAYKYVEYAVQANVVRGYGDGTYRPTVHVDRGQMAVFVARALVTPSGDAGIPDPEPPPSFSDVPGDYWCYKQVEFVHSRGVVQGYGDGTYRPDNVVTRDQMTVYVQRAFELQTPPVPLLSVAHDFSGPTAVNFEEDLLTGAGMRNACTWEGISWVDVSPYSVVILPEPGNFYLPYEADEVNRLCDFVAAGGGLVLIANVVAWNSDSTRSSQGPLPVNTVAQAFGLEFGEDPASLPSEGLTCSEAQTTDWAGLLADTRIQDAGTVVALGSPPVVEAQAANGDLVVAGFGYGGGRVLALALSADELREAATQDASALAAFTAAMEWASYGKPVPSLSEQLVGTYWHAIWPSQVVPSGRLNIKYSRLFDTDAGAYRVSLVESTYQALLDWLGVDLRDDVTQMNVVLVAATGGFTMGDLIVNGWADVPEWCVNTLGHELGHQWVQPGGMPAGFGEGWANFSSYQPLVALGFSAFAQSNRDGMIASLLAIDPDLTLIDAGSTAGGVEPILKAYWFLCELDQQYGPTFWPAFMQLHRQWAQTHSAPVSMADLVDLFSQAAGTDLSDWFRQHGTTF